MVPTVTLIAGTAINWPKYVQAVNAAIGRSPTRGLDKAGIQPGPPGTYAQTLMEFEKPGVNPLVMTDVDRLLNHLSLSYLISLPGRGTLALMKHLDGAHILSSEPAGGMEHLIATATLLVWRTAIVQPSDDHDVRQVMNKVWADIIQMGLRALFADYNRKDLRDTTFMLEKRK